MEILLNVFKKVCLWNKKKADLLLTARAKDIDEFRKVLLGRIQNVEGITETKTMMVIYGK